MRGAIEYSGLSVGLAAFGAAVVLAACGSSSTAATPGTSNGYPSFVTSSECIGAHGVTSFPDATFINGGGIGNEGLGLDFNSLVFQSAQTACGNGPISVTGGTG